MKLTKILYLSEERFIFNYTHFIRRKKIKKSIFIFKMSYNATIATTTTVAAILDPLIHNMSCDVPHDDVAKIYTYRLTSTFVNTSIFIAVLNFILMVPASISNVLILMGIVRTQALHSNPYKLIFSICFADLITSAVVQPIYGTHIIQITKNSHQCGLSNFLIYIVPVLILLTMVTHAFLSLERFCSVHFPTNYAKIFSAKLVNGILIGLWVLSGSFFVIPFLVGKSVIGGRLVVSTILVAIAICSYCYLSLYQDSKQQHVRTTAKIKGAYVIREEKPVDRTPQEHEDFSKNIKISSMLFKLFICMLVIYLLALIKNVLNAYEKFKGNDEFTMNFAFDTILFSNSFINPILIFYYDKSVKDAALSILL